jgi:NAD dependent epimerase/dehydratase family enzyme
LGYKKQTIEELTVLNADYIIHLAGANIAESHGLVSEKKKLLLVGNSQLNWIYSVLKK